MNNQPKAIQGTVKAVVKQGMSVRITPTSLEGKRHQGKEFTVAGEPRELCGTEVVALKNADGSRFSPAFDISMLEITDTKETSA